MAMTEAAVDLCRLAGKFPSGTICEIANDDGTMARLPQLEVFAERHGLLIVTIKDLVSDLEGEVFEEVAQKQCE